MPTSLIVRLAALLSFVVLAWTQNRSDTVWNPRLLLSILDADSGEPLAARVSILVDGREHEPRWIGPHGLRFVSVHVAKQQTFVATFARGTGPLEIPLPSEARRAEVHVAKGFDYLPEKLTVEVSSDPVRAAVRLRRWNRLHEAGWRAADTHLHYDRTEPAADRDWFDMMEADGLTYAEFMTLKGGMVPGVWAGQYAYGRDGEGAEGQNRIIPGEEYRDQLQGHLLLFGLAKIIQPIMAGTPESPGNWPLFFDVLERARRSGGVVGVAHGGTLGASPTATGDAALGSLDFMETGWMGRWALDLWYELANCGYVLPPTAGTDLPNYPYRDPWQPFLGSTRTYAKVGDAEGSDAFHEAIGRGDVFVTSGPIIRLSVNGQGPGGVVRLPAGGGEIDIEASLESPREVRGLEVLRNGRMIEASVQRTTAGDIHLLTLRKRLQISESSWLFARGMGAPIVSLNQDAFAHTAAVRVLIGDRPIFSPQTARSLVSRLQEQKNFYQAKGTYADEGQRGRMMELFDRAIAHLGR